MRFLAKWLFAGLIPFCLQAAEPRFYLPLDGNGSIIGPDGKNQGSANITGASAFVDGVNGKALDVRRQAYDQVTTLNMDALPPMDVREGTVTFRFRPEWNGGEPGSKWLFSAMNDKKFSFYFIKTKDGALEFSACAPDQRQVIVKNPLKAKEWTHLAVAWSVSKGEVAIYVNGKCVGREQKEAWKNGDYDHKGSLDIWLGQGGSDRFKAEVGDGAYDDFRIYDRQLSDNELLMESIGGKSETFQKQPLSDLRQAKERIELRFSYPERNFVVPRTLFKLQCGKANIAVSAAGASQKLVMSSGDNILESPYTIDLRLPLTLTLIPKGEKVEVFFDGASQGFLKLNGECGKATFLEASDKLKFEAVPDRASAAELAALTEKASPFEKTLWTLKDAERRKASSLRDSICLNGLWRIFRDESYSYAPIKEERQEYSRVPGSFASVNYSHYHLEEGKLEKADFCSDGHEGTSGWFQRSFAMPEGWAGKRIFLNLEDVKANYGRVYLNGTLIDSFHDDFEFHNAIPNQRRIDITDLLEKENVISVYMERFFTLFWKGKLPAAQEQGMLGLDNVWLEAAPSKLTLKSAIAFPSFRKKTMTMRACVENPSGVKGPAEIEFAYSKDDAASKTFTKEFNLTGEPEQVVEFSGGWSDPRLWTAENPELYRQAVKLTVAGKDADALPASNFGFREAWVENGEFKINGQKARLRMWTNPGACLNVLSRMLYGHERTVPQVVALLKQLNYDTVRMESIGSSVESDFGFRYYLNETDRRGVYNLMPMPPYTGGDKELYRREVESFLEAFGTHPSVIMWYTDFNTCHYQWNQDPAKLNDTEYNPDFVRKPRELAYVAENVMRSLDPSRELFQHAGGNSGKIFTSMNYQSLGVPVQEREDWPKQWAAKHAQPLMVVECGFPYFSQFEYFDTRNEMMYAEHAARFFGDSAYRDEVSPVVFESWNVHPFRLNSNMLKISDMLYRKVVPSWRAYDVSAIGDFSNWYNFFRIYNYKHLQDAFWRVDDNVKSAGAKPDCPGITWGWSAEFDFPHQEKLFWTVRDVFSPLLVFLGGRPDDFTNKDHAFFSSEKFEKSVVVVNDKTTPQKLEFRWEFLVDGKLVSKDEFTEEVEAGGILKAPLRLQAPEVAARTEAKLRLDVFLDGKAYGQDELSMQIFPKGLTRDYRAANAGLYDPAGKTEVLLKKAGFPFRKVSSLEEARKCQLLIIGQDALGNVIPDFLRELESSGELALGCKILLFEQRQCNVANLVFESPSYRNAFIRRPDSPYVRGLKTEDFSDWRGSSDTVPSFILSAERSPHYPRSKWKCGNGGIVAGNVIRKPSYGNFSTIVDCGFNLMFAGLMELRKEHGLLLFCQLDVTSRYGNDPAATLLVDNLLTEMATPSFPAYAQTAVYIGDDDNAKLLERMGMSFTRIEKPRDPKSLNRFGVIILGRNSIPDSLKENYKKAWEESKNVFVALPGAQLDVLPGDLKRGKTKAFRAELPKDEPLFAGMTEADLYYRSEREMEVLKASCGLIQTTPGIFGRYQLHSRSLAILNLSPSAFNDHFWNEEKVSRVWSCIFNNLNLRLGQDLKCFTGTKMRANTITPVYGEIELRDGMLKLDLKNDGKVTDTEGFKPIKLGISWEAQGYTQENPNYQYPANTPEKLKKPYDGYAWIRVTVKIPESWKGLTVRLKGGPVDDSDWTYFNGVEIGETTLEKFSDAYARKRDYVIPSKLVRYGQENTLMIRVFDRWGEGGVTGPLKIVAENPDTQNEWSPYVDNMNFYDVDAFHNW